METFFLASDEEASFLGSDEEILFFDDCLEIAFFKNFKFLGMCSSPYSTINEDYFK